MIAKLAVTAIALMAIGMLVACAPAAARPTSQGTAEDQVTATPSPQNALSAAEILDDSRTQMQGLKSVHFSLTSANGQIALGPGMSLSQAEGDAVAPDRVDVKTSLGIGGQTLPVEIIGVAGTVYLRDPIFGRWTSLGSVPQLQLFSPTGGLAVIMRDVQNVRRLDDQTIDGVPCYHLQGTLDPKALASMLGSPPASDAVSVDLWIGAGDFLVRQIVITGPIQQSDSPTLVMTLKLSNHNESISIQAPTQ